MSPFARSLPLALGLLGCSAVRAPLPAPSSPLIVSEDAPFRAGRPALAPLSADSVSTPPEVQTASLANGLALWVAHDPKLPFVALSAVVPGAGTFESDVAPELVRLTTRAVVEGGLVWTDGTIVDPPAVNGELVTFVVSPTHSRFNLRVLRAALAPGVDVLARTLRYPAFGEGQFDPIRLSELNAMRDETGVSSFLLQATVAAAYGDEHSRRVVPMRKKKLIEPGIEAVRAFYRQVFQPQKCALIAVGDVTLDELRALAEQSLGSWAAGPEKPKAAVADRPAPTLLSEGRNVHFFPSSQRQGDVLILQPAPPAQAEQDELPFQLLAHVALGAFRSRANTALRHDAALTYGVRPHFLRGRKLSLLTVEAAFDVDQLANAIAALLESLAKLQTGELSAEELARGKSALAQAYEYRWRSNGALAGLLGQLFADGRSPSWLQKLPSALAQISAQDVQRVARRYLQPERVEIGVSGDSRLAHKLSFLGGFAAYEFRER